MNNITWVAQITGENSEIIKIGTRMVDGGWEIIFDNEEDSGIAIQNTVDDAVESIEKSWGYLGNEWNYISCDMETGNPIKNMRTWTRDGYKVVEVEFDYSLHAFEVIRDNGEEIATITPDSIESMNDMIEQLDDGGSVDGWEDGCDNTIHA